MPDLGVGVVQAKMFSQLVAHIDRTVLAAGTANGYGDITAIVGLKSGQPAR